VDVKAVLRQYLINHHLAGTEAGNIGDATPLLSYGILDSLAMVKLITFLEQHFGFEFTARELDRRKLETIDQIEKLVRAKLEQSGA
jgi:acyl carrier protein